MEEVRKTFDDFLEYVLQEHEDNDHENKEESDFVDMLLWIQREKANGFEINRGDIRLIILVRLTIATALLTSPPKILLRRKFAS